MTVILDGEALAARLRRQMAAALRGRPCLAVVLVGDDPASQTYVARKEADCAEIGVEARRIPLPVDVTPAALLAEVARLNADASVQGLFVQFPLPPGHDPRVVAAAIRPEKDVDGLSPANLGRLVTGAPGLRPCTAAGVLALLTAQGVPLAGREVVIVGRGLLTGRPLALMLSAPGVDAVVTLAHSRAPDLARLTRRADVVISAAGVPGLIRGEMIRPGAAVLGVGQTWTAEGAISDLAPDVAAVAGHVTPPAGGIGALTRAMLIANLIAAADAG